MSVYRCLHASRKSKTFEIKKANVLLCLSALISNFYKGFFFTFMYLFIIMTKIDNLKINYIIEKGKFEFINNKLPTFPSTVSFENMKCKDLILPM